MVHLQTLGGAAIQIGSTRLGPSSARAFSALLFLAVERGRRVSRSTLHALLFPASTETNGLHSVRQLLYKLRQAGAPLEVDADTVVLPERAVVDDYTCLLAGDDISAEDLERMASGFLPGYAPDFSEAYTDWLEQYRANITLSIRRQLVAELARLRRVGKWDRAAHVARACLALDPLNEEATLALAEVLALSGSKTEAVRLLDRYLSEVGGGPQELRVPAALLRRRIAERFPEPVYRGVPQAPLIGRDDEMAELARHLELARQGRLQTVLVSGDAGIGKSRLVSEFGKVAVLRGAVVRTMIAQPHDKRRPLSVFVDLTPELRALPGALGCAPESLQLLSSLVAVEASVEEKNGGHPTVFANATRALSDLIDAVSSEATLVIVVEDAHWVDQLSLITLADLTAERQDRRVLFLLTSREPRLLADAPVEIRAAHLPLPALGEARSAELLREFLRGTPGERDAELQDWCVRTSGGNPFFLHALANHHAATGERFAVPASLTELLARRLERLDRRAATVFDACVLLGKHSTIPRLGRVLGVPALDLAESLRALEEGGFVLSESGYLRSTHYLLSEVAAKRMPASVGTLLHARVAEALEASDTDEQDTSVLWDAAEHWHRAGEGERAVAMLEARAERAMAISQPQQAVELYERALELATQKPQRATLSHRFVRAAQQAQDWSRLLRAVSATREADRALGIEQSPHGDYEHLEFDALRLTGSERVGFRERLLHCLSMHAAPVEHRIAAARRLIMIAEEECMPDDAFLAFDLVAPLLGGSGDTIESDLTAMIFHTTFGDRSRAIEVARKLMRVGDESARPDCDYLGAQFNAAFALYRCGVVDEAEAFVIRLFHRARAAGLVFAVHQSAASLSNMFLDRGDVSSARHWLAIADASEVQTNFRFVFSGYLSSVMRLALLQGRPHDARIIFDRTTRNFGALKTGRHYHLAHAYRIRIRQLCGEPPAEGEALDELVSTYERVSRCGVYDDAIAAIWHGLLERGQRDTANQILDRYLQELRRDAFPPAFELRQILEARSQEL